jgi:hypothetical protein
MRLPDFFEFNYFLLVGKTLRSQRPVVEKVSRVHVPDVFMKNSLLAGFSVRFTVS